MPSSITLTVSHLPSSTSFFLSALQPLDYSYRGRTADTIGFGPASSPSTPTDFWITQEIPGVPAGAAHVAFSAPNSKAVQSFFIAALKAGGKLHGEPAVRDSSGYYSAAVIDFDGNSIEAVFRPTFSDDKENDARSVLSNKSSVAKSKAASTVARSSVSRPAASEARAPTASQVDDNVSAAARNGDIFDNLLNQARTAANLAQQVISHPLSSGINTGSSSTPAGTGAASNGSGDAIIGTLLGVAAGAALHYAFSNRNSNNNDANNDSSDRRPSFTVRSVTEPPPRSEYQHQHQAPYYRAIEAPTPEYGYRPASEHGQLAITMQDNDNGSAIRAPPSIRSRTQRENETAIEAPSSKTKSTTTKASRQTTAEVAIIEAPHPTSQASYKSPTVLTTVETIRTPDSTSSASKSKSSHHSSTSKSKSSHTRSHSPTRSRSSRHSDTKSDRIVTRVTESVETISRSIGASSDRGSKVSSASTIKPVSKAPSTILREREPEEFPLPVSRATTVIRDREPEEYPLPISRASTWTGSFHDSRSQASKASKASEKSRRSERTGVSRQSEKSKHSSASKHGSSKSKSGRSEGGRSEGGRTSMSKSVVGKLGEMDALDVTAEEVGPEDSVSQVSTRL